MITKENTFHMRIDLELREDFAQYAKSKKSNSTKEVTDFMKSKVKKFKEKK